MAFVRVRHRQGKKILTGYFYHLHRPGPEGNWNPPVEKDWIVCPSPRGVTALYGDVVKTIGKPVPLCPINPSHDVEDYRTNATFDDMFASDTSLEKAAIVAHSDGHLLVRKDVAERIEQHELKGAVITPVRCVGNGELPLGALMQIYFGGKRCPPGVVIDPADENQCPFCEFNPVICPKCNTVLSPCPNCGAEWVVSQSQHRGAKDRRAVWALERQHVIDGKKWDGSDFFGQDVNGKVTRRVVDVLLSMHAVPFAAEPIPVIVDDMTPQELDRLEQAKTIPQLKK